MGNKVNGFPFNYTFQVSTLIGIQIGILANILPLDRKNYCNTE